MDTLEAAARRWRSSLSASADRVRALYSASANTLDDRPADGAWSAAECISHLAQSALSYESHLREALATAPPTDGTARVRHTILGRFVIHSLTKDRKYPAPRVFLPRPGIDSSQALSDYERAHAILEELFGTAAGRDLNRAKLVSPAFPLLRINAGDAFAILAVHEERHLAQAERAARNTSSPPRVSPDTP